MSEFTIKTFDTLVADMAAWVIAHAPQITDLNAGSVLRSIIEGMALGLEEVYVSGYLGFQRELATMPQNIFNFAKIAGTHATTTVQFTGPTAGVGGTTIAAGTHVKTASGQTFTTDSIATIAQGDTVSNTVAATAEDVGVAYNVGVGEISILGDSTIGVNSVTNGIAATGGTDSESDSAWQQRFQLYIEGLGVANKAGVLYTAQSYAGIKSVSFVELTPPQNGVDAIIYVDNGSLSGVPAATIAAIQALIDGDGTQADPGRRGLGVNVVVAGPTIVTQNVTVTIWLLSGIDATGILDDVNAAITAYINGLPIGTALIRAELGAVIMGVYGVMDCIVSVPTANVAVSSGQVVRVGTITVNIG